MSKPIHETHEKFEKDEKPVNQQSEQKTEFGIQRIYIKDISYESPNSPGIFKPEWEPQVDFNMSVDVYKLEPEVHEVVLKITVGVKSKEKTAFLIEVKQAGIFNLKNFPDDQLRYMLGSYCPGILFPYARELVSELVTRGTFPPLYLTPVNFDAMYQQHLEKEQHEKKKQ